eukprot:TRINITY_DN8358_c0_g1_i2.p2 TRINITY_DN8358_c0_g1~~TRINITY_DN8358_c0_g1_i2.p2  ORF type:complete len:108 (+),score=10.36 TRINITY_DN8358_c0_g1_i2:141-464(+)
MDLRKDSLAAAAQMIVQLEDMCRNMQYIKKQLQKNVMLVCTVGEISVWPGASNVIPAAANFSVDIRSDDDELRNQVIKNFINKVHQICGERQLSCEIERHHDADSVK